MSEKKIQTWCGYCRAEIHIFRSSQKRAERLGTLNYCNNKCYFKHKFTEEYWTEQFWSHVDKTPGQGPNGDCWVWTGDLSKQDYPYCYWMSKRVLATQVSYYLTTGYMPDSSRGEMMCHSCDFTKCIKHLFLGNNNSNSLDKCLKDRQNSKLGNENAFLIRALFATGKWSKNSLAKTFKVSNATIANVVNNKIFKHVAQIDFVASNREEWVRYCNLTGHYLDSLEPHEIASSSQS